MGGGEGEREPSGGTTWPVRKALLISSSRRLTFPAFSQQSPGAGVCASSREDSPANASRSLLSTPPVIATGTVPPSTRSVPHLDFFFLSPVGIGGAELVIEGGGGPRPRSSNLDPPPLPGPLLSSNLLRLPPSRSSKREDEEEWCEGGGGPGGMSLLDPPPQARRFARGAVLLPVCCEFDRHDMPLSLRVRGRADPAKAIKPSGTFRVLRRTADGFVSALVVCKLPFDASPQQQEQWVSKSNVSRLVTARVSQSRVRLCTCTTSVNKTALTRERERWPDSCAGRHASVERQQVRQLARPRAAFCDQDWRRPGHQVSPFAAAMTPRFPNEPKSTGAGTRACRSSPSARRLA